MAILNQKKEGDSPYIAIFEGKRIEFYAQNLWCAKQFAVAHFKPSKRKAGLLSVNLATEE